jgi:hypothetical protein
MSDPRRDPLLDDTPPLDPPLDPRLDDDSTAMVKRAQRKAGVAGAIVMGAMVAIRDVLEEPPKTDPVTVEASSDPHDVDADGISIDVQRNGEDLTVASPPLAPLPPRVRRRSRPRTR